MNIKFTKLAIVVLAIFSLTSCYKKVDNNPKPNTEKPSDPEKPNAENPTVNKGYDDVLVINEGNFNSGDATLSLYNSTTKATKSAVFASKNGFPFVATIQNVRLFDGKYYAVTNKGDKVEILDASTFESKAIIKNTSSSSIFANPFDITVVDNKAFVTNWGKLVNSVYDNSYVMVIDLSNNSEIKKIAIPKKAQHILAVGKKIYVTNVAGSTVSVINADTYAIDKTITVSGKPDNMLLDKDGMIWVICNSGNLVKIDPVDNSIKSTVSDIKVQSFNAKFVTNHAKDKLYYMNSPWNKPSDVYEFDITATQAPSKALISGKGFYGLGVSKNGEIYVGDAKAFQGNGEVIRYKADGSKIDAFTVGRGPSGFIFR